MPAFTIIQITYKKKSRRKINTEEYDYLYGN